MNLLVEDALKRLFDFAVSSAAIPLLVPLHLLISAAIKLDSPGPVFFRQERLGKKGRIFRIFKYRTMEHGASVVIGSDYTVVNPENDSRVTKVGNFLRKTSLDEIPQLINVFLGQMSIVGPRPDLPEGLQIYNDHQRRKLEVKPGITGLAQISGRNLLSAEEKWNYDVKYVESRSLATDFKIIIKTIIKVFKAEGIYKKEKRTPIV